MPSYIKEENNKVIYNGEGELIYYVPEKYFELKAASIIGEKVETLGLFMYSNFTKGSKSDGLKIFKCPTIIQCIPSGIEKVHNMQLEGMNKTASYRLLHFSKGDELICSLAVPQSTANVEKFVNLLTRANLPEFIPYDELFKYLIMNGDLNGFNYKVSNQIIGLVISELCRDKDDLTKPFRLSGKDNMMDYVFIPINKAPKFTSPYMAVTSENPDEAIAAAMNVETNQKSPLESIMMESKVLQD